jgi:hypothetical protein
MPYEVITHRERGVGLHPYRDEPYHYGDMVPDEAFDFLPKGERTRRVLLENGWIKPAEPGAVTIDEADEDDSRLEWVGGPWFRTPDGVKHRGKKKALAHLGAT